MSPCDHCIQQRRRKVRRGLFVVLCALLLSLLALGLDPLMPKTVGRHIPARDVTAFVYTRASSVNPPEFVRWRMTRNDDAPILTFEQRSGSHWPLTEKDISSSSAATLSPDQWQTLLDSLEGGLVTRRTEDTATGGSGPFMYLYWQGDRDVLQQYAFSSPEAEQQFLSLCQFFLNPS